jgi:hypothetical protein
MAVAYTKPGFPALPAELGDVFDSHADTQGIVINGGKIYRETHLPPDGSSGPFHHHLSFDGELPGCEAFISIEGLTDEPLGDSVESRLRELLNTPSTQFPKRLQEMTQCLFGFPAFDDLRANDVNQELSTTIKGHPYRLLSGVRATLRQAEVRHASKAIYIVQEFWTSKTNMAKMESNVDAVDSLFRLLLKAKREMPTAFEVGRLLQIPLDIPLYVGRIRTDVR